MSRFWFLTFTVFLCASAFGQSASQLQQQLGNGPKKKVKRWGTTLTGTTLASAKEISAYNSRLTTSFSAQFRYKFDSFKTRVIMGASKDLTKSRQDRFTSGILEVSDTLTSLTNSNIISILQLRAFTPVNDERREQETYRGGLGARLLNIIIPPAPNFQIINIASLTKNFHEFEINRSGATNTSHSFVNTFITSYSLLPQLELSGYLSLVYSWDYQGTFKDSFYSLGQSLTYTFNKEFSVTAGHEMGGLTYGIDGNNVDVNLFDTDASTFYASLTFNY